MNTSPAFGEKLKQAMAASAQGDGETAVRLFREAVDEQPGFAVPPFLLGAEFAQMGRIEEAIQAFAAALLLAPELHVARYQLGLLQYTSGHAALALVTWQPLTQLPEAHPLREFVFGFAALAEDRFADAITRFRAGQALNTDNAPLNGDIQMVIDRIEALVRSNAGQPAAAVPEEGADADASHVLLSNYRNGSFH
jgi:Flp pilus assembly protein TadD